MEYRKLGTSGVTVSAISLGAWLTFGSSTVDEARSVACIHRAIEQGVNFIDVADMYSYGRGEEVVGQAIKDYNRSHLVVSTKCYWPMSDDVNDKGLSRKHVTESVNQSLKRFDMEYVDIFFCHRYDDETPTEETMRAIEDLIAQGKVLYWGTSMWTAANLDEAYSLLPKINMDRPVVEQPIYNMFDRDQVEKTEAAGSVEDAAAKYGMGLVVWSPLAEGILTGKYNDGIPENSRAKTENWSADQLRADRIEKTRQLTKLAQEMGTTPAALAIAWTIKNPQVSSSITGATRPEQVDENLKALDVKITDEINAKIEAILQNKPE